MEEALALVRRRVLGAASWPEAVCLGIDAFVRYASSHEALMRTAFVDVCEAGPGVAARMTRPLEELARSRLRSASSRGLRNTRIR